MFSKRVFFRLWYYFRIGWGTYFSFVFAAINTLTVTYYLAIDKIPELKSVFTSFLEYAVIVSIIGIPVLVGFGYFHFKRSRGYSSEADILAESHPYYFKLPPGWHKEVLFPLNLVLSQLILKIAANEKPTEEDIKNMKQIQEKIKSLIDGEMVGKKE
jgi:hypothetical protein